MQAPNKFWFYHSSLQGEIFFADKVGNQYAITGESLEGATAKRSLADVEEYFDMGYWVLTVPNKFKVTDIFTDTVHSITKDANGLYVWKSQETGDVFFYRHEDVLNYLYGESSPWEPIEESENQEHTTQKQQITEEPTEEPAEEPRKRMITMNVNDVRAAAEFDVANNTHTKAKGNTVEEIEREILGYLREMYDALMDGGTEWELHYTGTRTYRILFQPEDDHYGTISILSDTSVGMPTFFADVNDFLSQN